MGDCRKGRLARLHFEKLAEMVDRLFIVEADERQLEQIERAIRGEEYAYSQSGQWVLSAKYPTNFFCFSEPKKGLVFLNDGYSGERYQLSNERDWEKFYRLIVQKIHMRRKA